MTRVSFARLSDAPPPARELVDVEADGSWTVWRSTGPAIGRFAGPPGDADGERILGLAEAAMAADIPPPPEFPVDATIERLEVDGKRLSTGYRTEVDGPWGELLRAAREQLKKAIDHPVAAITLEIVGPGRLRLRHIGTDPLSAELGDTRVEGTVWSDAGEYLARGKGHADGGPVEAGPGWTFDVQLDGIDPSVTGNLVAAVDFVVDDEGAYIPVLVSAGRAPG